MENLNEDFEVLHELLRTAYKLISPLTYHDDIERLTPSFLKKDYVKTPGCYLAIGNGAEHTIFPICNRFGYKDPKMIKFSLKLAQKMSGSNEGEGLHLPGTIIKLEKLLKKYDKSVPNTRSQAVLKGNATKRFNRKMITNEASEYLKGKGGFPYNAGYEAGVKSAKDASNPGSVYSKGKKYGKKVGRVQGASFAAGATVGLAILYKSLKYAYKQYKDAITPEARIKAKTKVKAVKNKIDKIKAKVKK